MKWFVVGVAAVLLSGCATSLEDLNSAPDMTPVGANLGRPQTEVMAARETVFSGPQSSWQGGAADYFRDARARQAGDLLTVKISVDDKASLNNSSNRSRKSNTNADANMDIGFFNLIAQGSGNADVTSNTSASGQGATVRSEKIQLSLAAVVKDVMPNGLLLIEGSQEILVNYEKRRLVVQGLVNPRDITPDNTIGYEKVAEARISYGGQGRLSEVQQPGWGQQLWDKLTPF